MSIGVRMVLGVMISGLVLLMAFVMSVAFSDGSPESLRWAYAYWLSVTELQGNTCRGGGTLVAGTLVVADMAVYGNRHIALAGQEDCISGMQGTRTTYLFQQEYDLVGFRLTPTGFGDGPRTYQTGNAHLEAASISGIGNKPIVAGSDVSTSMFMGLVKSNAVARVVFRFASGTVVGRPVDSGVVAVTAAGDEGVCEMVAYDGNGAILERVDLRIYNHVDDDVLSRC